MSAASNLSVVRHGDQPPPFVPAEIIIRDYPEALMPQDIFDSDWWATAEPEERLYGFTLNLKSYTQKPSGSLPSDDRLLARLAECDVASFKRFREKVLEGWVLCSDGRYYRPSIAIKVLAFWISRLFKRRSSAAGNAAQDREVPDQDEFNRPIFLAEDALARLDPTHKQVRKCRTHRAKLAKQCGNVIEIDEAAASEDNGLASPGGTPDGTPVGSPKVSEAKRSHESSGKQSLPATHAHAHEGQKIEQIGGIPPSDAPWEPWPDDWWQRFWSTVWMKTGTEAAHRALDKVRKRKLVTFDALLAGVERYKRSKPDWQEWCHPATWINQRRWQDGDPLPATARPPALVVSGGIELVFVEHGTAPWAAWQAQAKRVGKAGYPADQQQGSKRGWRFPTLWPPGHPGHA